ncbi:hypothetical protein THOM_0661 [Trachipleistophora hominis]|uniref:Uncharacterized protein n=1 Tax=Trachipleistophora hominis TaxID=72359 RepID=L7JY39_TRAHO|nr:hypothetical protein THOM_0661 [Trachipleistophora hominis]
MWFTRLQKTLKILISEYEPDKAMIRNKMYNEACVCILQRIDSNNKVVTNHVLLLNGVGQAHQRRNGIGQTGSSQQNAEREAINEFIPQTSGRNGLSEPDSLNGALVDVPMRNPEFSNKLQSAINVASSAINAVKNPVEDQQRYIHEQRNARNPEETNIRQESSVMVRPGAGSSIGIDPPEPAAVSNDHVNDSATNDTNNSGTGNNPTSSGNPTSPEGDVIGQPNGHGEGLEGDTPASTSTVL